MTKPKYKKGHRIESMADFSNTRCEWFVVVFGQKKKTTHRSFLISLQYRTLEGFINSKRVYVATPADEVLP